MKYFSGSDEVFKLGFLRYDKFNVDKAFQKLENFFLMPFKYPNYYLVDDHEKLLQTNLAMIDSRFMYSLPERDELGRMVFICRFGIRDPNVHSIADVFRLYRSAILTWALAHETQIAGCQMIFDFADVGLKHLYTPQDIRATMDLVKNVFTIRQKGYYIINLNKVASTMIDIFKSAMSEKMASRLHVLGKTDDLFTHIKPKTILPCEYNGGKMSEREMIEKFKQLLIKHHNEVTQIFNSEIDKTKIPTNRIQLDEGDVTGSFRTLEID
jgi:hypothetical protein